MATKAGDDDRKDDRDDDRDDLVEADAFEESEIVCGHCGHVVVDRPRPVNDVARVGCGTCGVQLIRRPGEGWQTIRG